jgi:hypothetical protein
LHLAGLAGATLVFLDGAGPLVGLALHLAGLAGATLVFLDGAGPLVGLALHLAGLAGAMLLFLDGAGPLVGLALHLARVAFLRRAAQLALRRTLGSTCAQRIIHALLGRGQAAASDQGRSCDRTQQTLSHLGHSFITANRRTA